MEKQQQQQQTQKHGGIAVSPQLGRLQRPEHGKAG
jgi:hypothetical protein